MQRRFLFLVLAGCLVLLSACAVPAEASSEAASSPAIQMEVFRVPVGLALLAGLASFLSPCVLSLVPVYIGYLSGRAAGGESTAIHRWVTLTHGLAFVSGFSVVFILFNIIASALGNLMGDLRFWLEKIGGLLVVIFGLHMIGLFRIRVLEYDLRVHSQVDRRFGLFSSFLLGVFFSAGWSPCIGPVLGAIITLSLHGGSVVQGALLGLVYSAGLAIPFLLAALGIGWVSIILRRYNRVMRITEIVMGVLLVVIGALLLLGKFNLIAGIFPGVDLGY